MPASPHLNQPGGRFRPSTHPRVAGREHELRSLADAVRRLVAITVDSDADAATTAAAADRLHALADELAPALVPVPDPPKHATTGDPDAPDADPHDNFQFDAVLGLYNPLALPVEMTWEPPVARGRACFTTAYEGPPGCVHGAMIAAAFDQVFNVANLRFGVAGPTAYLHVDYRRPTLLRRDLVFEGWVEQIDGRKVLCRGRIVQGEAVTCEAEGLFVQIPRDEISRLSQR
jgi:acyl-coenzyme A thioesterase PaaI-like protein